MKLLVKSLVMFGMFTVSALPAFAGRGNNSKCTVTFEVTAQDNKAHRACDQAYRSCGPDCYHAGEYNTGSGWACTYAHDFTQNENNQSKACNKAQQECYNRANQRGGGRCSTPQPH